MYSEIIEQLNLGANGLPWDVVFSSAGSLSRTSSDLRRLLVTNTPLLSTNG